VCSRDAESQEDSQAVKRIRGGENVMKDNKHRIEVVEAPDRSNDEFFYGPGVGQAVRRGDFLYTRYGDVLPRNAVVRMLPCSTVDENYADWSEEYRRAVRAAYAMEDQKMKAEEAAKRAEREALVEQARVKLTTEEFEAVYDAGFEDGRR
jgi:hypothetical protein